VKSAARLCEGSGQGWGGMKDHRVTGGAKRMVPRGTWHVDCRMCCLCGWKLGSARSGMQRRVEEKWRPVRKRPHSSSAAAQGAALAGPRPWDLLASGWLGAGRWDQAYRLPAVSASC